MELQPVHIKIASKIIASIMTEREKWSPVYRNG